MHTKFLPFLAILSLVACCIEIDISVPGFPAMANHFNVSDTLIQLTIAYNFFGFCLASLLYGPLSESYGRRKVMLIGNAILLIGAVGCVVASSITHLLIARFIQGIGASTSAVVVFAMIADAYPSEKATKLIGFMNAVFSALIALAPVAGGCINEVIGWRGNYTLVACICLVSWLLLTFLLPETKRDLTRFDVQQMLKDYGKLLSNPLFISAACVPSLLYAAYLSFVSCASFLYIESFGLSTIAYALHQAFIVACFSVMSIFSGRLIQFWGKRMGIFWGTFLCGLGSLGLLVLSLISLDAPYLISLFMAVFSIGIAICYPIIFTASLEIFPEIKGTASSAIMAMRAFLCAAFVGITSYYFNGFTLPISVVLVCIFTLVLVLTLLFLRSSIEHGISQSN